MPKLYLYMWPEGAKQSRTIEEISIALGQAGIHSTRRRSRGSECRLHLDDCDAVVTLTLKDRSVVGAGLELDLKGPTEDALVNKVRAALKQFGWRGRITNFPVERAPGVDPAFSAPGSPS